MEVVKPRNSNSKENVVKTWAFLKNEKDEKSIVQQRIKEWAEVRRKIIERIDQLEKNIESVHTGVAVARGVGAGLGIAGGLMSITGVVMALKGKGNAHTLMNRGGAINLIGNVTSVSATLIELGYTQKVINEINRELKRDKELTDLMSYWIQRSHVVDAMLVKIFGCSVKSDIIKSVIAICSECITIFQITDHEVRNLIRESNRQCGGNALEAFDLDAAVENVRHFLRIMHQNPELRESLRNICCTLQKNPFIYEFSKLSLKVYLDLNTAGRFSIAPSLKSMAGIPQTATGDLICRGLLDTVKIAADALSLIFVAQDIKEEKTEYSKQLDKLKVALSMELNTVLNNYPDFYTKEPSVEST